MTHHRPDPDELLARVQAEESKQMFRPIELTVAGRDKEVSQ